MSKLNITRRSGEGHFLAFAFIAGFIITGVSAAMGDGGSKCPDSVCSPAPAGVQCSPRYGEQGDGCCPVWHCVNGQTAYGMSKSGTTSFSSFSSSSSSGNGGAGGGGGFPMMPMGNPFASLFGGFFGR